MTPLGKETLLAEGQPVHVQLAGWPRTEPLTIAELSRLQLTAAIRALAAHPTQPKLRWELP